MVQASELRSGNYVLGNPLSIPRMGIYSDGVTKITAAGIAAIESGHAEYEPIPLTADILEKAGFVKKTEYAKKYWRLLLLR